MSYIQKGFIMSNNKVDEEVMKIGVGAAATMLGAPTVATSVIGTTLASTVVGSAVGGVVVAAAPVVLAGSVLYGAYRWLSSSDKKKS